jgi:uncharacterized RDD family membrane protein YckC
MTQQAPAQTELLCARCKRVFAQSDLVQIAGNWVCGECKPAYLSQVLATGSPSSLEYAGVGIRFGARVIDGFVLIVPFIVLAALIAPGFGRSGGAVPWLTGSFFLAVIVFAVLYEVLMLRFRGATVGKIACGVKVVRPDGGGLGWGVSFGRFFMWNVVTNGIPYVNVVLTLVSTIMAGLDNESRALHDRVCDTRVIRTRGLAQSGLTQI